MLVELLLSERPAPIDRIAAFAPAVVRTARRRLGADEAAQTVAVGVVLAGGVYDPMVSANWRGYLLSGGLFALRDALGRRRRWDREVTVCPELFRAARHSGWEARADAATLIDHPALTDRQALVLDAVYRVGLTRLEVCRLLGMPSHRVGRLRSAGVTALRSALGVGR